MRLIILVCLSLFAFGAAAEPPTTATPAPQWYLDDVEFLTRDGGKWIASNADYQSTDETIEAYVIEWQKGYANSMTGRLYGIVDGKPTGDFWRFQQYWHPGKAAAQVEQFGFGGAVGIGRLWQDGDANKTEQLFYAPDGGVSSVGHIARNPDADTHVTDSFNIVGEDWTPNRTYVWKRERTNSSE